MFTCEPQLMRRKMRRHPDCPSPRRSAAVPGKYEWAGLRDDDARGINEGCASIWELPSFTFTAGLTGRHVGNCGRRCRATSCEKLRVTARHHSVLTLCFRRPPQEELLNPSFISTPDLLCFLTVTCISSLREALCLLFKQAEADKWSQF